MRLGMLSPRPWLVLGEHSRRSGEEPPGTGAPTGTPTVRGGASIQHSHGPGASSTGSVTERETHISDLKLNDVEGVLLKRIKAMEERPADGTALMLGALAERVRRLEKK